LDNWFVGPVRKETFSDECEFERDHRVLVAGDRDRHRMKAVAEQRKALGDRKALAEFSDDSRFLTDRVDVVNSAQEVTAALDAQERGAEDQRRHGEGSRVVAR